MHKIRVDTALLDGIAPEYGNISEALFYAYKSAKSAAEIIGEFNGFNIELLAEQLFREAEEIKSVGNETLAFRGKTKRASEIYSNAEKNIERDINNLPVLIHGNISAIGGKSEVMNYIISEKNISENISESALICGNTVVHEDWLIKLIAKNKFGG
ncbi:MAG: hypothetical protein NC452_08260 [Eubacterium sp.]|nr:hypothetical protein [Eubacterium sp.]